MDKDEAFDKMKFFAYQYKEDKNKGQIIGKLSNKQLYRMAKYFYKRN